MIQLNAKDLKPWVESWIPHPALLQTALTAAAWNGDAYSTTAKTLIDLSAVFGVPAGVKQVKLAVAIRDSGSAANECWINFSPTATANIGSWLGCSGLANDKYARGELLVNCDANGDIYYQIVASGAGTMDVWIYVLDYYY